MGKRSQSICQRCSFAQDIYKWGWRWVVFVIWALPYGLAGLYDLLHGQGFLPSEYPTLSHSIVSWLPSVWLIIGVIVLMIVTIEGAYRKLKDTEQLATQEIQKLEEQTSILMERARPKLIIQDVISVNNGGSEGSLGLLVCNQGTDTAMECRGQLVGAEFTKPPKGLSLCRFPANHALLWREELANKKSENDYHITGRGHGVLEVFYWVIHVGYGSKLHIAYMGDEQYRRSYVVTLDYGSILTVVSITSKDATPIYAIGLLDKAYSGFGYDWRLLDVRNNEPTMNECRQLLSPHREDSQT